LFFLFIGLKLIIKPKKNHFWSWNNTAPCDCNDPKCDCEKSDNQKF
jgi:hypothetical protein